MPLYEYVCDNCGKSFTELMTITEHGKKKLHCPKCASKQVRQVILPFTPITARKT